MTVVLRGYVMHDGRWMSQGDMYMSPPDEMNGDLVFGPDGAVLFILFDKRSGILPKFLSKKEQDNFYRLFRKDAEETASGKSERSVAIFPLRDEHTDDRIIMIDTLEAAERYRRSEEHTSELQSLMRI